MECFCDRASLIQFYKYPEDGRNYRPKQVELIEIINKPLLLHLVGYLYYWQMGLTRCLKG